MVKKHNTKQNVRHRIGMECILEFADTTVLENHAKLGTASDRPGTSIAYRT